MRWFIIALIAAAVCSPDALAQENLQAVSPKQSELTNNLAEMTQTRYKRLHSIRKRYGLINTRGSIDVSLVQLDNLTTGDEIMGVEVSIQRDDSEMIGSSLAVGGFGSIWGTTAAATYANIRSEGHLFLSSEEVEAIMAFINSIIPETSVAQGDYLMYRLTLRDRFELGMLYDPTLRTNANKRNPNQSLERWRFIFTIDEATYSLVYEDGIDVLKKLDEYNRAIREWAATQ